MSAGPLTVRPMRQLLEHSWFLCPATNCGSILRLHIADHCVALHIVDVSYCVAYCGRHRCVAYCGRFLVVSISGPGAIQEASRGMGRILGFADCDFRGAEMFPHG